MDNYEYEGGSKYVGGWIGKEGRRRKIFGIDILFVFLL